MPKEFRFDDKEVYIKKTGRVVHLIPRTDSWDVLFDSLKKFSKNLWRNAFSRSRMGRRASDADVGTNICIYIIKQKPRRRLDLLSTPRTF